MFWLYVLLLYLDKGSRSQWYSARMWNDTKYLLLVYLFDRFKNHLVISIHLSIWPVPDGDIMCRSILFNKGIYVSRSESGV